MTKRAVRMAVRAMEKAFSNPWIVGGLVASQILCYAILIPLAGNVAAQARNGAAARDRSCALRVASTKVYDDARARGVITSKEFTLFTGTAAKVCNPAK